MRKFLPAAVAAALTGACTAVPSSAPDPAIRAPTLSVQGLERVMGQTAQALTAQFGPPALDVREMGSRKLQFAGAGCVLDAYLYPPQRGREPVVTHVDARRADNGADVDRAGCVAALGRRR